MDQGYLYLDYLNLMSVPKIHISSKSMELELKLQVQIALLPRTDHQDNVTDGFFYRLTTNVKFMHYLFSFVYNRLIVYK